MEPSFDHDFSHVRVHTDSMATESAEAVQAMAYTVGHNVVFGAGRYQPSTNSGRELIAHELTHVLQQRSGAPTGRTLRIGRPDDALEVEADSTARTFGRPAHAGPTAPTTPANWSLQRACLSAAECAAPNTTLDNFVADTENDPKYIANATKRKKACTKKPPDAACTSDGHGALASALTAILKANYPSRATHITGIFVDKDMPATWGAVTQSCSDFMPPLPGGQCTFVPDTLEAQGKLFQRGGHTVAGLPRAQWLISTIGTLTHETEHARFDTAPAIPQPNAAACKFSDHEGNLSEMAAHLAEMHVYYRAALAQPSKDRFNKFHSMFDFWVKNGSEDISGIVKDLRCKCECTDADYFITKTAESVASSQKWDTSERFMIHTELRDPKWALKWPVTPPAVAVGDLPTTAAAPLKFE
jgi:hypothetical protein